MRLTNHIKLRYVQRILKIEDENKAYVYLSRNNDSVQLGIYRMFRNSELLYANFSPHNDGITYDYYLYKKKFIMILQTEKNLAITLYEPVLEADRSHSQLKLGIIHKKVFSNDDKIKKLTSKKNEVDRENRNLGFHIDQLNDYLKMIDERIQKKDSHVIQLQFMRDELRLQLNGIRKTFEENVDKAKTLYREIQGIKHENRELLHHVIFGFKKFELEDGQYVPKVINRKQAN